MRNPLLGILCVSMLMMSGCAGVVLAPVVPSKGLLYANTKAPLDVDMTGSDFGSKTGKAESISYLGLVTLGDASIKTAAANGSITQVKHADYEVYNILGVYSRFTTIVYGD